jgi:PAS domain-containing protein
MARVFDRPAAAPAISLTLDDLPMAAALLDERHRVLVANQSFREAVADAGPIDGRTLSDLIDSVGAARFETGVGRVYRLKQRSFQLARRAHAAGALVFLTEIAAPRASADNMTLERDVRSQLMHDAEIGIWRYDPDTDTYLFSSELSLGHDGAGAPVPRAATRTLLHPDDHARDDEIIQRLTHEGGQADAEMRYSNAEGQWTHLRVLFRSGARRPSGLCEIYGVSQNITALADARDASQAMNQRHDLALKASRAGVFEYDYVDRTYWISEEFECLMGPEAMARFATDPFGVFSPEDQAAVMDLSRRAMEGPNAEPVIVHLCRPDGNRWVRIYFDIERDADGRPRRGVGLMIDVDAVKRQELALREAQGAAEAATRAKSDFLASVSHEIRTPMNGVVGVMNLLKRESLSDGGAISSRRRSVARRCCRN